MRHMIFIAFIRVAASIDFRPLVPCEKVNLAEARHHRHHARACLCPCIMWSGPTHHFLFVPDSSCRHKLVSGTYSYFTHTYWYCLRTDLDFVWVSLLLPWVAPFSYVPACIPPVSVSWSVTTYALWSNLWDQILWLHLSCVFFGLSLSTCCIELHIDVINKSTEYTSNSDVSRCILSSSQQLQHYTSHPANRAHILIQPSLLYNNTHVSTNTYVW